METFLTREHLASNPLSIADLIAEMNELIDNQKTIPDDPAKVANLMFMLEGQDMVSGLMTTTKSEGQIQAMVGILGSAQLEHLISSLDGYVRGIDSKLVKVSYTGMPLISWHLDQSVLQSQAESLRDRARFHLPAAGPQAQVMAGGLWGLPRSCLPSC